VSHPEPAALPAESLVVVEVVDPTSDAEFPLIIAQQIITPHGLAPIPFAIELSPALIDPNHDYAVRARIVSGGGILFHTGEPVAVITNGRPSHADLMLVSGAMESSPPAATGATPIPTP
jgi:putative lipoprotein